MSESAISAQQLLQAGKLGEALRAAEQELVDNPQDVDTLSSVTSIGQVTHYRHSKN